MMVCGWIYGQAQNPFEVYRNGVVPPTPSISTDASLTDENSGTANPYEVVQNLGAIDSSLSTQTTTSTINGPMSDDLVSTGALPAIDNNNPFEIGQSVINHADILMTEAVSTDSGESIAATPLPTVVEKQSSNSFIFWFLLLSIILLTAGITSNRKSFKNLYRLISNQNYLKLQNREQKGGKNLFYTLLYISFILNMSIFTYLGYSYLTGINKVSILLKIIAIVTIVYGLRHVFMNFLRYFVDSKYLVSDYDFMITVINVILGLILLPIVLFTGFSGFQYAGLILGSVVIVLLYFTRQTKGVMAAMNSNETGVFHFFIYLCTFEIGPILIALRLLKDYSGIM